MVVRVAARIRSCRIFSGGFDREALLSCRTARDAEFLEITKVLWSIPSVDRLK